MDREQIDQLWNRATRETLQDGTLNERYRFAKLVAAHERKAIAADADWCVQNHLEHLIPERIRARGNK